MIDLIIAAAALATISGLIAVTASVGYVVACDLWRAFRSNECSRCGNRDLPPPVYLNGREAFPPCDRCGNTGEN